MKAWEELTRTEKQTAMRNYRAEWLRDCKFERDTCPNGWERYVLTETLEMLRRSKFPHIVYDSLTETEPEDLARYY